MLLLIGILALMLPVGVAAEDQTAVFTDANPPAAPFHAHQSMLLFVPGAEAALHRHGGPGYITILSGELTLYEDGEENIYQAGDSLVETSDKLYKGGNYTDEDTTLMVTYLVPHGEEVTTYVDDPERPEPPELTPEPMAMVMHDFTDVPDDFDVIHVVHSIEAGADPDQHHANGPVLFTAVEGNVTLDIDGEQITLGSGEYRVIDPGSDYAISSDGDEPALAMSTEFDPVESQIMPAAGNPVSTTDMVIWLLAMTAMTLLVIGGSMRILRPRLS
jgi:quercetin dioxygenase-like cupin family protein